jgi:cell division transport system permease protein
MLRRLDLPLMQTAPGRVLPWLTGGLVYVTMVLLGIAVMADQALLALDARARLITVILPLADDDGGSRDVDAALDVLLQKRFVIAAARVGGDELRTLMTPWLGEPGGDLPLPAMIDVRLDPLATPDLAALQDELSARVAGATLSIDATVSERGEAVAALVRGWSGFLVLIALLAGLASTRFLSKKAGRPRLGLGVIENCPSDRFSGVPHPSLSSVSSGPIPASVQSRLRNSPSFSP